MKLERGFRQRVAHDRFQLHLAERAARTLVAEQFLQADHAAGQGLDLLLRLVDGRQPRHHVGERLVGLFEALVEPFVDLAADLAQTLVDFAGQGLRRFGELRHHRLAAFAEVLRERQLQRMQRVARLLEFFGGGAAQALGVVGQRGGQAVALFRKPVVQVDQHRAMAFLLALPRRRWQFVQRAAQADDAAAQATRVNAITTTINASASSSMRLPGENAVILHRDSSLHASRKTRIGEVASTRRAPSMPAAAMPALPAPGPISQIHALPAYGTFKTLSASA